MPIFIERYLLPLLATITVGIILLNPMGFDITQRVSLGVAVVALAVFFAVTLHNYNESKNESEPILDQPSTKNIPVEPITKTEPKKEIATTLPPPYELDVWFEKGKAPFVDEIEIEGEKFRAFRVEVEHPLSSVKVNLRIECMESNEFAPPLFPDYSTPLPESFTKAFPEMPPRKYVEFVMQSVENKQKIIFGVPYTTTSKMGGKATGLWCKLVAENEPNKTSLYGSMDFWLHLDKNNDLQIIPYPKPKKAEAKTNDSILPSRINVTQKQNIGFTEETLIKPLEIIFNHNDSKYLRKPSRNEDGTITPYQVYIGVKNNTNKPITSVKAYIDRLHVDEGWAKRDSLKEFDEYDIPLRKKDDSPPYKKRFTLKPEKELLFFIGECSPQRIFKVYSILSDKPYKLPYMSNFVVMTEGDGVLPDRKHLKFTWKAEGLVNL